MKQIISGKIYSHSARFLHLKHEPLLFCFDKCDECYNWETHQRKNQDIPMNNEVDSYDQNGNHIHIIWNDGHHSRYSLDWINDQRLHNLELGPVFWTAQDIQDKLPSIETKNEQLTETETKSLITSLLKFGVAFVHNVNSTKESTEKLVNHIGPIMHTLYGGMWDIDVELLKEFEDTAYTNEYLLCHTDTTYLIESAGLQVFHCTKNAVSGGETVLVDGFKAATLLKERHYEFYECLKSTPVEWQYIGNGHHLMHTSKIIQTREYSDELEQIRFNIYDRGPRYPFTQAIEQFYRSVSCFQKLLQEKNLQLVVKLRPGTVAFINNWRVLHGRTNFHGRRKMHGCYVAMGTFLSKARKLKLLK